MYPPPTHLVDDAAAWLPKANAILGTSSCQKVIHLFVGFHCQVQICLTTKLATTVHVVVLWIMWMMVDYVNDMLLSVASIGQHTPMDQWLLNNTSPP